MKKRVLYFVLFLLITLTIFTMVWNIINNDDFWDASVSQILTLLVAIGLAFWATNFKTDERISKEHVEKVLAKLQQLVTNEKFYRIPPHGDPEEIRVFLNTNNRRINNCLTVLNKYGKRFSFSKEIEYIDKEFKDYRTRVGNHITDLDYLSKTEKEFKKTSENIDSKCDQIIVSLYT